MAEASVLPIAAAAPVKAQSTGSSNTAQAPEPEGQPSFAQVLKSRTASHSNPPAQGSKPAAKPAGQGTAEADRSTQTLASAADPALAGQTEPALLGLLAEAVSRRAGKSEENSANSADQALPPALEHSPEALPDPAIAAAALASSAANLAGKKDGRSQVNADEPLTAEDILQKEENRKSGASLDAFIGTREKQDKLADSRSTAASASAQLPPAEALAGKAGSDKAQTFSQELGLAQGNASASASQAQTSLGTPGQTAQLSRHEVSTPVAARGWTEEVGQKISWIASRDNGRAELVLTPANMGRVEVSIQMSGDQANASFVAANALAREALQDAMPRLREVLAQAGIQLGQASVDSGQGGNQTQAENTSGRNTQGNHYNKDIALSEQPLATLPGNSRWTGAGNGMIDTFA